MENNIKFSILLEVYGKLLTEKQYELLDFYYNQDFGLSEIAENLGITRQAVRDNLKKGENNLVDFENKLNLLSKKEKLLKICDEIENSEIRKKLQKQINEIIWYIVLKGGSYGVWRFVRTFTKYNS